MIVALSITVGYLLVGWLAAKRDMPRLWSKTRDFWSNDNSTVRTEVIFLSLCTLVFWPVRLPFLLVWHAIGQAVDKQDPVRWAEIVAEQKARIAELERELDIR